MELFSSRIYMFKRTAIHFVWRDKLYFILSFFHLSNYLYPENKVFVIFQYGRWLRKKKENVIQFGFSFFLYDFFFSYFDDYFWLLLFAMLWTIIIFRPRACLCFSNTWMNSSIEVHHSCESFFSLFYLKHQTIFRLFTSHCTVRIIF